MNLVPKDAKWYNKTSTIFIAFIFIGPLVLPLVWMNKQLSLTKKIIYSFIMIVITILLMVGFGVFIKEINQLMGTYPLQYK